MVGIENPTHIILLAAIALIVLGPRRLPKLARALGEGIREFRQAMQEGAAGEAPHQPDGSVRSSGDAPDSREL
ncbi:MAG TPA: twin-arginine translocase TatA/TatE family subunit [Solirubrobacteraceae bacterium]|nr:twin-arginine translocase TatA/TatE family subunit [Solirubrobacteraceae bacterium]